MTGRVRSVSSRSEQTLCWPSVAEVPSQALKSAVALVLCICAGGSEQVAHDGWHSLRPENGAELPRQFQSRHNLVCDQRLSTAKPGSQGPVFVGIGGTHQSGLGTEGVRLIGVGITIAVIKRSFMESRQDDQASTEPRGTRTRGGMSVGGASTRGAEHPYIHASHTCLSTPLN